MGIAVTKRTGGFTIQINSKLPIYASSISYYSSPYGVKLLLPGQIGELLTDMFNPGDWTIQEATGYTTNLQVADALDAIGAFITSDASITSVSSNVARELQKSVMVSGVSTGGTPGSLVDGTKRFEVNKLVGKILKFTLVAIEYFREILSNTASEFFFAPLNEGQFSTAVVGEVGAGQVTILTATRGDFNSYTVEFVAGVGNNVPLSAAYVGEVLTVTLATDGTGALDAAVNTATAIAAAIDALPEFTATMTGAGGAMIATVAPIPFTGGVDPVVIPSTTEYQILEDNIKVIDAAGIGENPIFRVFAFTLTRPANQTVYAAGDVIGDVSAALTKFLNVAKAVGYGVVITNIRLQTNDTGLAGKVINLHFYSDTVDPIADNAAFALTDANAPKRRGMIQVTFGTGTLGKVAQAQFENLIVVPVSRDIPLIMETVAGFTPSANSTWIRVEIGVILGN